MEEILELNIHLNAILSVLNENVLDLNVHDLTSLTLIGTEVVVNHRLPWWLAVSNALAGIIVTESYQVISRQVPEGRTFRHRQEERPVRVVHPVEGVNVYQVGFQVGVMESLSQATDVAHPILGLT